jgi:hypothetical protein
MKKAPRNYKMEKSEGLPGQSNDNGVNKVETREEASTNCLSIGSTVHKDMKERRLTSEKSTVL